MTSASPTPLNRLRKEWREKRPTFGAIATIPSVQTVQIMAQSLDWIIVDLEHGPIDLTTAHAMIVATSGTSCVPMARIVSRMSAKPRTAKRRTATLLSRTGAQNSQSSIGR